jgi:hypothetical protein
MTESDDEAFAEATLSEAIENQLRDGKPLAAKFTLERLLGAGHDRAEAIAMMAEVLGREVRALLDADRPFDMDAYVAALRALE